MASLGLGGEGYLSFSIAGPTGEGRHHAADVHPRAPLLDDRRPVKIKQDICEIGRRIYAKGFAAANDGNITVRISENEVLCTPTMHCKGFLKPEDICTIDMTGKQIAGIKKRSSEALLHLEIYKQRPT
jgi:ribulose-5-phosphate 4-epimerase/fuculose-1-phosphate aldolase